MAEVREKRSAKLSAFDRLRLAREKGTTSALFDDDSDNEEPDKLYDEVDEATYASLRRRLHDEFVEDDDDAGDFDDDEDDIDDADGDEDELSRKKDVKKRKVVLGPIDRKPKKKINSIFLGGGASRPTNTDAQAPRAAKRLIDENDESFMEALLSGIDPGNPVKTVPTTGTIVPTEIKKVEPETKLKKSRQNLEDLAMFGDNTALHPTEQQVPTNDDNFDGFFGAMDAIDSFHDEPRALEESTSLPQPQAQPQLAERRATFAPSTRLTPSTSSSAASLMDELKKEAAGASAASAAADAAQVPNVKSVPVYEDGKLMLFWFDLCEQNGVLYLFGKVPQEGTSKLMSCCVAIKNMNRNVFLLPREKRLSTDGTVTDEDVTMTDVYNEFSSKAEEFRITKWESKAVTRKYAFELPNVPTEAQYMKIVYPYSAPALPLNLQGQTFSHAFGTNTSALEMFLRKRNLMGPCWLSISNCIVSEAPLSWCKYEVVVTDPKDIVRFTGERPSPSLVVVSIALKTLTTQTSNEIAVASAIVHQSVNIEGPTQNADHLETFLAVRQQDGVPFPPDLTKAMYQYRFKVNLCSTERSLLSNLLAWIFRVDPDVVVGHNFTGFALDVLLHRLRHTKTDHWSRLGRLRRSIWPKLQTGTGGFGDSTYAEKQIMSGRLICDTYLNAKDLLSRQQNYSLAHLASTQLNVHHPSIDFEDIPGHYQSGEKLLSLMHHCREDARLTFALLFKLQILPLTNQLTNLAGNLWSHTLAGARAERNEYLLLHEFHKLKYICPDKAPFVKKAPVVDEEDGEDDTTTTKAKGGAAKGRRKPAYAGGLVLEPKRGFYDKFVIMLDFNSLYPSIIREYNICFTTVQRTSQSAKTGKQDDEDADVPMPDIPDASLPPGILPSLLRALVDRRKQAKNIMKQHHPSSLEYSQFNIRQQALKLTANSMYGCLGFSHSRFYAKPLAMLITSIGRDTLQKTVDIAEQKCHLEVIYGDTDSLFINTNSDDLAHAKQLGFTLKKEVNQKHKLLEIELDGIFQKLLLLKKKKYVALLVDESEGILKTVREIKGVDMVRRDWCDLAKDVSSLVLDEILSGKSQEDVVEAIHENLQKVAKDVRDGVMPLQKFVINKSLTKSPDDYADAKNQPHVQVALRMKTKGQVFRQGDTISYVICQGESPSPAQRAYHPDEIQKQDSNLAVDIEWYIKQQLHAPIMRLCEPLQGTDAGQIASCLGLDASKFGQSVNVIEAERVKTLDSQLTDEQRYADVTPFKPSCRACGKSNAMQPVYRKNQRDVQCCFICPESTCGKELSPYALAAQLNHVIREDIQRYYDGWVVCDEPSCRNRTRQLGVYGRRCLVSGCRGVMHAEFSDSTLYCQLSYYSYLFDVDHQLKKLASDNSLLDDVRTCVQPFRQQFLIVRAVPLRYLNKNARRFVDLGSLFSFIKT